MSNQILWWLPQSSNLCAVWPCTDKLRQDFWWTRGGRARFNASWVLLASWCMRWSRLPSRHHIDKDHYFTGHKTVIMPLPADGKFLKFFSGQIGMVPYTDCLLVSGPKLWTQASSAKRIREGKVSPSALKHVNNSGKDDFSVCFVFCREAPMNPSRAH